jgi:hypothetical protein
VRATTISIYSDVHIMFPILLKFRMPVQYLHNVCCTKIKNTRWGFNKSSPTVLYLWVPHSGHLFSALKLARLTTPIYAHYHQFSNLEFSDSIIGTAPYRTIRDRTVPYQVVPYCTKLSYITLNHFSMITFSALYRTVRDRKVQY